MAADKGNNQEKKEPSPEEQRALNVKNTLEWKLLQDSVGTNSIRTNQGEWGKFAVNGATSFYNEIMNGEDAIKEKKAMYEQKAAEYDRYNVFGEAVVLNSEVSLKLSKQLEEVIGIAKFSEIEDFSKKIGATLNFRVPEEMKDYSMKEIINSVVDKEKGIADMSKLSDSYKEAFRFYNEILSHVYERTCAANIAKKADYFADINAHAMQLGEKYQLPKEAPKDNNKPKEGAKKK